MSYVCEKNNLLAYLAVGHLLCNLPGGVKKKASVKTLEAHKQIDKIF